MTAYLTPRARAGDVADNIGVNTHIGKGQWGYQNNSSFVATMQDLGVKLAREPYYDSNSAWDTGVKACMAVGVRFSIVSQAQDPTSFATKMASLLTSYPGMVKQVEGLNEPNNFYKTYTYNGAAAGHASADAYQTDLLTALRANSATASLKVAGTSDYPTQPFARSQADLINLHIYPGYQTTPAVTFSYNLTQQRNGQPDFDGVTVTECGAECGVYSGSMTQLAQARLNMVYVLNSFQQGFQDHYIFELFDQSDSATTTENGLLWGLMGYNGTVPKLAYKAIKHLLVLLKDLAAARSTFTPSMPSYTLTGGPSSLKSYMVQKANGRAVLFVWFDLAMCSTGNADPAETKYQITLTLTGATTPRAIWLHDVCLGHHDPIAQAFNTQSFTFQLGLDPLALSISGAASVGGQSLNTLSLGASSFPRTLPPTLNTLTLGASSFGANLAPGQTAAPILAVLKLGAASFGANYPQGQTSPGTLKTLTLGASSFSASYAAGTSGPPTLKTLTLGASSFSANYAAGQQAPPTLKSLTLGASSFSANNAPGTH